MTNPFNEDYFLRGIEKGISNYVDYRWMPDRTMPFAQAVIDTLGISHNESLVDIGCARGYAVKALRQLGVNAVGFDTSEWAIKNCDPDVEKYVSTALPDAITDFVLAKDVFEHVELGQLMVYAQWILARCSKSALIMVPLSIAYGQRYIRDEDEWDATHLHRWSLNEWMEFFSSHADPRWTISGSWHLPGLKPTSISHPKSCGFITLRRTSPS